MSKFKVVGVCLSLEDPKEPFALQIKFPMGVVTQPCSQKEFLDAINDILKNHECFVEVVVSR